MILHRYKCLVPVPEYQGILNGIGILEFSIVETFFFTSFKIVKKDFRSLLEGFRILTEHTRIFGIYFLEHSRLRNSYFKTSGIFP